MKTNIKNELLKDGIGFVRDGNLIPFSIDDQNPMQNGSIYGLNKNSLTQIFLAWKQWRKFAQWSLDRENNSRFFTQFLKRGTEKRWSDLERSETVDYVKSKNYFCDLHITRVDLAYNNGTLKILDPNVVPYGMIQLIESEKILGMNHHIEYFNKLLVSNCVFVADESHGGSHSIKSFCEKYNMKFMYSHNMIMSESVYRISRRNIVGSIRTVNAPGIRSIESQFWSALMNMNSTGEYLNFNVDNKLHRKNTASCYLVKLENDILQVATGIHNGEMKYISYKDFLDIHWGQIDEMFLKGIYTSGCHQVTFSDYKATSILKAVRSKIILNGDGYFLLQPSIPCVFNDERIRVSVYFGNNGQIYGAEVTRVPLKNKLAHDGEHAKISYLQL